MLAHFVVASQWHHIQLFIIKWNLIQNAQRPKRRRDGNTHISADDGNHFNKVHLIRQFNMRIELPVELTLSSQFVREGFYFHDNVISQQVFRKFYFV